MTQISKSNIAELSQLESHSEIYNAVTTAPSELDAVVSDSISSIIESNSSITASTITTSKSFIESISSITASHYVTEINNSFGLENDDLDELSDQISQTQAKNSPQFSANETRWVPALIERDLRENVSRAKLKTIHADFETSIELCLLFASYFSKVYFASLSDNFLNTWMDEEIQKQGWISLLAKRLQAQLSINKDDTYLKIRDLMLFGISKRGPMLEYDEVYKKGKKTYYYRLNPLYLQKSPKKYEFKTVLVNKLIKKERIRMEKLNEGNLIVKNLEQVYKTRKMPTEDEIRTEAKRLIKDNKFVKGKKLTFLNNHKKDYWQDVDQRVFVEDHIKLYQYLNEFIPFVTDEKAGGRVITSFNMIPAWIRSLMTIDGEMTTEIDCVALHPNLAMTIYEGNIEFITHEEIAKELEMTKDKIKIEHLSFWNKSWYLMRKSPLFDYYVKKDPAMMQRVYEDKHSFDLKHKATSRKLFALEVKIMTEAVVDLNNCGIFVEYIFDALDCKINDAEIVKTVINEKLKFNGVKTLAK